MMEEKKSAQKGGKSIKDGGKKKGKEKGAFLVAPS